MLENIVILFPLPFKQYFKSYCIRQVSFFIEIVPYGLIQSCKIGLRCANT